MREKTHSPMCRWSSGTARELSRHILSVWRSTTTKNGDANGTVKIPYTFDQDLRSIPELRKAHESESGEWANRLDPSGAKKRKACLASSAKTAIGLHELSFQDIAHLPDNALGEFVRQSCAKLADTNSVTFVGAGFVGQDKRREAEPAPSCTPLTVLPGV